MDFDVNVTMVNELLKLLGYGEMSLDTPPTISYKSNRLNCANNEIHLEGKKHETIIPSLVGMKINVGVVYDLLKDLGYPNINFMTKGINHWDGENLNNIGLGKMVSAEYYSLREDFTFNDLLKIYGKNKIFLLIGRDGNLIIDTNKIYGFFPSVKTNNN